MPGFQTLLWVLGLPPADDLDPKIVIPQDANRRMGISMETSQLAWHRLPDRLDRRRWVVVSATRRSLATLPEMVDRAGSRLRYMELRPFALARAVNQPDAMIVGTYIEGCDIVIVRDGTPMAYTGLYWGVDPLDGPTLVNRLAEAASRTAAVYNQNALEDPLPDDVPIYVFGTQIGREAGIAAQVASVLQRPLGDVSSPISHPPDFPVQDLMVNIGLLLALA
ncbi:MAG: hypothetical protein HY678_09615 [Chloroflexi bacterium]|nr:hypothetical protein [Chloroflexota bacterium]